MTEERREGRVTLALSLMVSQVTSALSLDIFHHRNCPHQGITKQGGLASSALSHRGAEACAIGGSQVQKLCLTEARKPHKREMPPLA